jgi:hypothetical protein
MAMGSLAFATALVFVFVFAIAVPAVAAAAQAPAPAPTSDGESSLPSSFYRLPHPAPSGSERDFSNTSSGLLNPDDLCFAAGTSIDQGIAYLLMIMALVLTYLIHPLDASAPYKLF